MKYLPWLYKGIAGLGSAATVVAYFMLWFALLQRQYSQAYEGPIVWAAVQLAQGHNIYPASALTSEPWITILYPPPYMLLGAAAAKAGVPALIGLRLVSMLSAIACGAALYRVLRAAQCSPVVAIAPVIFMFNFDLMFTMSSEARPDMLSLALAAFACERFVAARNATEDQNIKPYLPFIFLMILACFVKQQAFVFGGAIGLSLLFEKKFKLCFQYCIIWLGTTFGLYWLTDLASGGFFQHLLFLRGVASDQKILKDNVLALGLDLLKMFLAFIIAPLGVLINKNLTQTERFPLLLFLVAFVVMCYTMGIPASNTNHIMPTLFALSWWIGLTLRKLPQAITAAFIVLSLGTMPFLFQEAIAWQKMQPHAEKGEASIQALGLRGKQVLTDDPNINMLTGSQPVFIDCATFMNVWKAHGSDFKPLITPIEEKRYAAVLINAEDSSHGGGIAWWPPAVVDAIKKNYKLKETVYCSGWPLDVYVP
jgi:uncharacterized membrane protein YqaE (UPF0057 family)